MRVVALSGSWARVVVPDQPTPLDSRGYPGWIPKRQLVHGVLSATTPTVTVVKGDDPPAYGRRSPRARSELRDAVGAARSVGQGLAGPAPRRAARPSRDLGCGHTSVGSDGGIDGGFGTSVPRPPTTCGQGHRASASTARASCTCCTACTASRSRATRQTRPGPGATVRRAALRPGDLVFFAKDGVVSGQRRPWRRTRGHRGAVARGCSLPDRAWSAESRGIGCRADCGTACA